MSTSEIDYLNMSDEDLAKLPPPEPVAAVPGSTTSVGGDEGGEGGGDGGTPPAKDEGGTDGGDPPATTTTPPAAADDGQPPASTSPAVDAEGGAAKGDEGEAGGGEPKKDAVTDPKPDDKTPVVPFATELATRLANGIRANGKLLQIRNADEAEKLIQMGAGYTRKMQELAPALRIVKMLSNNELLDESKIAFLIDINQKNPAAIQKLLADSEFDPLSVDKAKADSYVPGDHHVSDTEVQFQAALDDLIESDEGTKLLQEIQWQWDKESKQALLKEPSIIGALNLQRSNGIYQQITGEVDRLTTLGQIPAGTPFLQAYRAVGDMLKAEGKLVPKGATTTTETPPAKPPQGQAPATQTPPANRGPSEAARDAAPVKATTTKPAATIPDFLAQSDEEFLKNAKV